MLCNTCRSINFRPLDEWLHRASDINDPANKIFTFVEPDSFDQANISRWRNGQGTINGYYFHHDSSDALLSSAVKGCYLCAVLSFALFAESAILSEPELRPRAICRNSVDKPVILSARLSHHCSNWREDSECRQIRLYCGTHEAFLDISAVPNDNPLVHTYIGLCEELEIAWEQNNLEPYLSTWSQHSLQLAKSWHQHCLSTHNSCRVGAPLLPKRVIDLGANDLVGDFQPILVEPPQPTYAEYIILSHCWGDGQPISLVKADEANKTWSLPPLSEWEQTFQDAVNVTKNLNVRYLWIDSPCILQGDRLDWETESVKMARYFQNATLCIHASRARSGTDGLFGFRNPFLTYPHHFVLPADDTSPEFKRLLCAGRAKLLHYEEVEPNSSDSPPSLRAWCLQEELLSPRMLSFGRKRIYWQCLSTLHSESRIGGLVGETQSEHYTKDARMHIDVPRYSTEWGGSRNPYHYAWYRFLRRFNLRDISYHNDVLPAIAGMAELFHSRLGNDKYLAGLWQQDIITGLLWSVIFPASTKNKRKTSPNQKNFVKSGLYAPSWSWVSMAHADLSYGQHVRLEGFANESACAQLVSTDIRLRDTAAPFGLIDLGVLVFLGKCPRLTITPGVSNLKTTSFFDNFLSPSAFSARSTSQVTPVTRMEMDPTEWDLPALSFKSQPQVSKYQLIGHCDLDATEPITPKLRRNRQKRPYVARFVDAFLSPHRTIDGFFLPLKTDQVEFGRIRTLGLVLVKTTAVWGDGEGECYRRIGCGKFDLGPAAWRECNLPVKEIRLV